MTIAEFVTKWKASTIDERSAAQQHFLDLRTVLGKSEPAEPDFNRF